MQKKRYSLVVGGGCSGMTLAILLAKLGKHVVLVEQQPRVGGWLRRFERGGLPWDTGYHFTGGGNSIMPEMFAALEIGDITFSPLPHRITIPTAAVDFTLPANCGFDGCTDAFVNAFRKEESSVRRYLDIERQIWQSTPFRHLREVPGGEFDLSEYDFESVSDIVAKTGLSAAAGAALNSFAMCHGSLLSEVPMSFHSRVSYLMHTTLARPDGGGEPVIAGFLKSAAKYGIDVRCATVVEQLHALNGECRQAVLSDGTLLDLDGVYFTIHPHAAAEKLPECCVSASVRRRLARMTETCSFFTAFFDAGGCDADPLLLADRFTDTDIDRMLRCDRANGTGIVLQHERSSSGKMHRTVTAFRTAPCGTPAGMPATRTDRAKFHAYREYKENLCSEIAADIGNLFPELAGKLTLVESGSPLTNRDYQPPTGSAYGVRCVCGQTRLSGNIPGTNCFFAGQSSMVPGVMGAMLSSFALFYQLAGRERYCEILRRSGV